MSSKANARAGRKVRYHRVVLRMCTQCLDGEGGFCNQPGCAFIRNRAPDIQLWDSPFVEEIDDVSLYREDGEIRTALERKNLAIEVQQAREANA